MAEQNYVLTGDYIELNSLLKVLGLAVTGGHAKIMIGDGLVKVDGWVETRVRRKLRPGQVVTVGDEVVKLVL